MQPPILQNLLVVLLGKLLDFLHIIYEIFIVEIIRINAVIYSGIYLVYAMVVGVRI